MPKFRPDLADIPVYVPGRTPEQIRRDHGLDSVIKLASNECPYEPFAPVVEAVARAAAGANRYPDDDSRALREALGEFLDIESSQLWLGGGSSELIHTTALAVGGPGTSAVYATPSFVLYRIASAVALAKAIEVPLDSEDRLDLDAMLAAIRPDTTVVYVCNPNNPTGTHVSAERLAAFVHAVPDHVLIVVDEAYQELATAEDFASAVPLALGRDNLVVARTFSKVYGLAGLRAGYLVGSAATLAELRRIQLPFSVSTLAQVAACEAIKHQDLVVARIEANRIGRQLITEDLGRRGLKVADSQTNFVFVRLPMAPADCFQALQERGVIVRDMGEGVRITVGTEQENQRLLDAFDEVLA